MGFASSPLMVVVGFSLVAFLPTLFAPMHRFSGGSPLSAAFLGVVQILNPVLQVLACVWVGMWFGLKKNNLPGAIAWTVGMMMGLPWFCSMLTSLFMGMFVSRFLGNWGPAGLLLYYLFHFVPPLLIQGGLIVGARNRLGREFPNAIIPGFVPRPGKLVG